MDKSFETVLSENEKLIKKIAYGIGIPELQDSLVQAGRFGLHKAYLKFDKTKATKFSTFAYPYIKGEMLMELRDNKFAQHSSNKMLYIDDIALTDEQIQEDPEDIILRRELGEEVRAAVKKLSPIKVKLIMWFYFDGFSLTDIAKRLRVSRKRTSELHQEALTDLKFIIKHVL